MGNPDALIEVHVRPSHFAAWFHHLFTRPVVSIDGREHPGRWGVLKIPAGHGTHRISVFFRYRGQSSARLAEGHCDLEVLPGGGRLVVYATLGPLNGSSFRVSELVAS